MSELKMMAYVVILGGKLHSVWTSPVDAHTTAKALPGATTALCRLNALVDGLVTT